MNSISAMRFISFSPTISKRKGKEQSQEVLGEYSRGSMEAERVEVEQQEAVNSIVNFFNWIRPKVVAPKEQTVQYTDPYANVRSDPYLYKASFHTTILV